MYEQFGLAAALLILALAGNLGEAGPPCCAATLTLGPAVLVFP